jgi:hypothetical protein
MIVDEPGALTLRGSSIEIFDGSNELGVTGTIDIVGKLEPNWSQTGAKLEPNWIVLVYTEEYTSGSLINKKEIGRVNFEPLGSR